MPRGDGTGPMGTGPIGLCRGNRTERGPIGLGRGNKTERGLGRMGGTKVKHERAVPCTTIHRNKFVSSR